MIKLYNAEENDYLVIDIDSGIVSKYKVYVSLENERGQSMGGGVWYTDNLEKLLGSLLLTYALKGYVHRF